MPEKKGKKKNIPSRSECLKLLRDNGTLDNITAHSVVVTDIAMEFGKAMKTRGENIDLRLLEAGALLHDIGKTEGLGGGHKTEIAHGDIGAGMLKKLGYPKLAEITSCHMFSKIFERDAINTWEKKLVYYADKRVNHDKRVTLNERLEYLINRYPHGADMFRKAKPMLLKLEKEIFEKSGLRI